jgi:hypothetical protein
MHFQIVVKEKPVKCIFQSKLVRALNVVMSIFF